MNFIRRFKREFVYVVVMFVILQVLHFPSTNKSFLNYVQLGLLGMLLLVTWLFSSYILYAEKPVSRISSALIQIDIKRRLYLYFILPMLFYLCTVVYLFYTINPYYRQAVIAISSAVIFALFIHIRSSYEKVFSITRISKAIFDFANIYLVYLVASICVNLGLPIFLWSSITVVVSINILLSILVQHEQTNIRGLIVLLISGILLTIVAWYLSKTNIFIYPAVFTLFVYFIISVWNIRLSGKVRYDDYLVPLLFTLMGIMIIFNI